MLFCYICYVILFCGRGEEIKIGRWFLNVLFFGLKLGFLVLFVGREIMCLLCFVVVIWFLFLFEEEFGFSWVLEIKDGDMGNWWW